MSEQLHTMAIVSWFLIMFAVIGLGTWITVRDSMWYSGIVNRWKAAHYSKREFAAKEREERQKRVERLTKALTRSNPQREDWWK